MNWSAFSEQPLLLRRLTNFQPCPTAKVSPTEAQAAAKLAIRSDWSPNTLTAIPSGAWGAVDAHLALDFEVLALVQQ